MTRLCTLFILFICLSAKSNDRGNGDGDKEEEDNVKGTMAMEVLVGWLGAKR